MIDAIGGYFELELTMGDRDFHAPSGKSITNGRSALYYILLKTDVKQLYVPYFSCNSILHATSKYGIPHGYYGINRRLEITDDISLKDGDYILYINYFGLKSRYIEVLEERFGHRLIVDNVQSYFFKPKSGNKYWAFNSARKFFGVPDGAYLYFPENYMRPEGELLPPNSKINLDHLTKRFESDAETGYNNYVAHEKDLKVDMLDMSRTSKHLLSNIDYPSISKTRQKNFSHFHSVLRPTNKMAGICEGLEDQIPFSYPYQPNISFDINELWSQRIYAPLLWPECKQPLEGKFIQDAELASQIIHLPIDHRYGSDHINSMIQKINVIEKRITK